MAQKYPTEAIETSSDFLVFSRGVEPTSKNANEDYLGFLEDVEKIKDLISCISCRVNFDRDGHRPLLLPCLAGICKMCTLNIQAAEKTSYECGKCLTEHSCIQEKVVTLKIDPTRELLVEIYRLTQEECNMVCEMCPNQQTALHRCIDCSHFICMDCVNLHSTLTPFKSHVVVETKCLLKGRMEDLKLLSSASSKQCQVSGHGKEQATLFCFSTSCIKPICMRCAITTHKDHDFRDISEVGKESETQVQIQTKKLLSKADQACRSIATLTNLHEQYFKISQELQEEIKTYFSRAKQAVEMREKKLLDAVSEKLNNEQSSIENEQRRLTSFVSCCKEACYYGSISSKIDDVQSFLDVAESIKSRFENLENQSHDNQTILNTIKFLKEPPITSHLTTMNSLGKLSVSKAISTQSTAVITPSVIEEHQQVQFDIQLLSSQGKPTVEEDVSVCLDRNGKPLTVIPCVLNKPSTNFLGSWIPEEPMQLTWIVVSNGIRMETLRGILNVKKKTQKLSTNFHGTQSKPLSKDNTVVTVSNSLQIKIYLGSIIDIAADVIVCPQDEFCSSDNPIAKGIFSTIGGHKPIPGAMGHTPIISQTPDKASPWKMIIHAVFPIYDQSYSKDPAKFGSRLNILMKRIIEKAEEGRYTSIAIPLLMEEKEGYKPPVELLALNFDRVVKRTAKEMNSSLKDIYIVLRNEEDENIYLEILREKYEITPRPIIQTKTLGGDQSFGKTFTNKPEDEETCCICMDKPTNPKRLHKCGHIYCKDCIDQCFSYKPACPSCGQIYGKMTGDQPPGTLSIKKYHQSLSGFQDSKECIVLTYLFHNGRQGNEHPNPDTPYEGIQRSGYVPNNEKGRLVAKLLNVAFSRRLVFTIGRSRTTGQDGVITWNDIHHKTRLYGGPEKNGYPDLTYLDRVLEELAAKGVTPESADDPQEYTEYSKLFKW
ncbi:uncharacterized protein LOC144626467 isoform X2 [Crassostrea virginica]